MSSILAIKNYYLVFAGLAYFTCLQCIQNKFIPIYVRRLGKTSNAIAGSLIEIVGDEIFNFADASSNFFMVHDISMCLVTIKF